jgi:iron complex outermembrane receptor protein
MRRHRSRSDGASVTGQWSGDWLRVGARFAQDTLDSRLPGALTAAQYDADPRQTTTPDDRARIRNQRTSVFARADLGRWELAGEAGTREKNLTSLNSGYPFDYNIAATNASLRARHEAGVAGAKNILVLGVDDDRWSRDVLGDFGSAASQDSRAWYAKDDVILAGGTRLSAGLRTERIVKSNSNALSAISDRLNAWEFGASQPLAGHVTVYGRVGRSFRLANVDEFSFTGPGAILKPQLSRDVELGARWAHGRDKLDARLYRSSLVDEIGFDPAAPGPFGVGANINFDPTRRQGLELDASHALTRSVDLRVNANLRQATLRSGPHAGRDVPLVPRRTLSVRADWAPAPGQRVTGGVNWVSSQHPDFDNACTVPAYTTADVRYAYRWRQLELSLAVSNLFDRKYYTQAFGCAAGVTSAIYPEAGRSLTAAVRVHF